MEGRMETTARPTAETIAAWRAEIAAWPHTLRVLAERMPPWGFVRIADTGAIGRVAGFHECEDGTVTIDVMVRRCWNEHLVWREGARDERVTGLVSDALETLQ
jgi:hypothetical protein